MAANICTDGHAASHITQVSLGVSCPLTNSGYLALSKIIAAGGPNFVATDLQMNEAESAANRRDDQRVELEHYPAKVICHTGEYLCTLRDVSTLGAGLSFLHAVPPEPRILLQLANGLTYPIERVWIGKRQAGYRFGCEVTLEEFTQSESGHEARAIHLDIAACAKVGDGRNASMVRVENISCEGVRFQCEHEFALNCLLGFSIDGLDKRIGQLRWRDGKQCGMQFQHRLTEQELADCVLQLQPFGSPFPNMLGDMLANARAA